MASAFASDSFGYSVTQARASGRYKKPLLERIPAMMSSTFPALIFEPKPPSAPFQRNPSTAAPNPPRPALMSVTVARLKNWRRDTPMASGSGGVHGAMATLCGTASAVLRLATDSRSNSLLLTVRSAFWSRERVSRDNTPVVSRRRAAVSTTTPASTTRAAREMTSVVFMIYSSKKIPSRHGKVKL